MTVNYYVLDFNYKRLDALRLAGNRINGLWMMCSEDSEDYDNGYNISFINEGETRTVTVDWEYFFFEQSLSFTVFNPPECPRD